MGAPAKGSLGKLPGMVGRRKQATRVWTYAVLKSPDKMGLR
jgi:hypothetical protein